MDNQQKSLEDGIRQDLIDGLSLMEDGFGSRFEMFATRILTKLLVAETAAAIGSKRTNEILAEAFAAVKKPSDADVYDDVLFSGL